MSDLIKREDAIKAINLRARIPHDVVSAQYASMAINAIRSVPSADRPQGEWIYIDEPIIGNPYGRYKCSECNLEEPFESDFCPNCGARMKGADDEYERAVEQMEHDMLYEPTYNSEDGSM